MATVFDVDFDDSRDKLSGEVELVPPYFAAWKTAIDRSFVSFGTGANWPVRMEIGAGDGLVQIGESAEKLQAIDSIY